MFFFCCLVDISKNSNKEDNYLYQKEKKTKMNCVTFIFYEYEELLNSLFFFLFKRRRRKQVSHTIGYFLGSKIFFF
jgi:hypothetical protein